MQVFFIYIFLSRLVLYKCILSMTVSADPGGFSPEHPRSPEAGASAVPDSLLPWPGLDPAVCGPPSFRPRPGAGSLPVQRTV